ncbi:MAG: HPF/RaiA family ribosome-associated protein [Chromatiaceae bacterium]|nr:HPF/RaiA family ribosome-associated protein [Chromatiaceae bacterium]
MQIDIETSDFPVTEALRDHAERQLLFALTCCGEHIRRVVMRLSDVNGPRGGPDKRCRLRLKLAGLPDLVVEDTQTDLYVAIDRATDRTGRTLVRKIGRRQTLLRHVGLLVSD